MTKQRDIYEEYMRAGVMPGNLGVEGEQLLNSIKEGKMLKKILVELVLRAYKKGREDEKKLCDADYTFFEKLVEEILQ